MGLRNLITLQSSRLRLHIYMHIITIKHNHKLLIFKHIQYHNTVNSKLIYNYRFHFNNQIHQRVICETKHLKQQSSEMKTNYSS